MGGRWGFTRSNAPARKVAIGDEEQLVATRIVVGWGNPDTLLLLDTDSRKESEWAKKGYAKKGDALIINQETSRWIASKRAQVDGVYARSGHNFSPDWMTRAEIEKISDRTSRFVFGGVRLRPSWGQMMAGRRNLILG